jgi:PAS domain S-box-containing protein
MARVEQIGRDPLEQSIAELEREKRVVETLYRVGQAVARTDDLQEIVQLVTDETTAITGARFGAFFYNTVRADGEVLALYTISGLPRSAFERFPMPRSTDIFKATYEGTSNVRIDDVLRDARFGHNAPYEGLPAGHPEVRSYLAVPVFSRDGAVVGGLYFGHEEPGAFSEEHERIATGIATQAGTAIDKARLFAAERDARAEAETRANAAISLEYVGDGVVMVDRDGIIRLWNRAAAAITRLAADAVLGRPIGEAVPSWERVALDVPVGGRDDRVAPRTLPFDALDGRELWVSLYGVTFGDGTVYAFRDVTGERELEALRADMIATVSHELRTPVAAVYGAAQTLRYRQLEPRVTEDLLALLGSESERLTHLVDEILLTSRLDGSGIEIARETVEPLDVAAGVVRSAALNAGGTEIAVDAPDDIPAVVADGDKVRQVLANLVENALKYGIPDGGGAVTVRLRVLRTAVRFEVADEGPGIPRREQGRIFEKFYRLDPQMKRGIRGTGLGLYICRELVHRMQGRIGIDSTEGRGATFWFELPCAERTDR